MQKLQTMLLSLALLVSLGIGGCSAGAEQSTAPAPAPEQTAHPAEAEKEAEEMGQTIGQRAVLSQTGWTEAVPAEYTRTSEHPGRVERLDYAASPVAEVMADPVLGEAGRLLFPANSGYWSGDTLGALRLTWYSGIDPEKTVEIVNTLRARAEEGEQVFYPIYTEAERAADPDKKDTGLFFFRGEAGAPFAVCNAGGAFAYVGAIHDSLPHALELSKRGYNAFALIYRPGWETAMADLGRAIRFIEENAEALGVAKEGYSLWGGSAGARMAATLGNADGLAWYSGRDDLPQAAAVVMQYTGHSDASRADAPTYACCGTRDGIANWRTMQRRLETLEGYGIPTEFHAYEGLSHGFGLGAGTVAEGWLDDAVAFWEANR